jgi:hypothetical protein
LGNRYRRLGPQGLVDARGDFRRQRNRRQRSKFSGDRRSCLRQCVDRRPALRTSRDMDPRGYVNAVITQCRGEVGELVQ